MKKFPRGRRDQELDYQSVLASARPGFPLTDPDLSRLMWMAELREFLLGPGVDLTDLNFLESLYIEYCTNWHAQPTIGRWNPQTVMNALGVVVGDCIRRQIPGAQWQLTVAHGVSYLVVTAADGLIVAAPLTEMVEHWLARDLIWISSYPDTVLSRLPQPKDLIQRVSRRPWNDAAIQPQI